jgi:N-acetylglucosaminyl-diphospho-decaprenol L-rhamnosyltransferase
MTQSEAQITAVIVTYQSRDTIAGALDALYAAHQTGLAECVVVDNVSSDGTAEFVAQAYPWVRLICSASNLGFGRGCNLGAESASTPYILLLNPDAVLALDSLKLLHDFMQQNPQCSIAAPAIVESDSSLQDAGLMLTPGAFLLSMFRFPKAFRERRTIVPFGAPFRTNWVCGAIMLIQTNQYRSLAGFDPRFFLYFEETDLCRRMMHRGGEIWAVGQATAEHVGGVSARSENESMVSNCISEHFYQSRYYFLLKHYGLVMAVFLETIDAAWHTMRRLRTACFGARSPMKTKQRQRRPFLQLPAPTKGPE